MNELDLYEQLSERRADGAELLKILKTAGLKEGLADTKHVAKALFEKHVVPKKPEIVGGAVAAAVGGAIGYAATKRWRKGGQSLEEKATHGAANVVEQHTRGSTSFTGKAADTTARYAREMSKVLSDHPFAGGAITGASLLIPVGAKFGRKVQHHLDVMSMGKAAGAGMSTGLRPIPKPGAAIPKITKLPTVPMPRIKAASIEKEALIGEALGTLQGYASRAGKAVASYAQRAGQRGLATAAPHLNKIGPSLGNAAAKAMQAPLSRRVAIPAAAGAAIGGVRHLLKPKDPYTGKRQGTLLGSVAKGGAVGAGLGLASRGFLEQAQKSKHVSDLFQGKLGANHAVPKVG